MEVSGKMEKYCRPCEDENEKNKASGICKQCEEYMCQRCFKHHRKARSCRNHEFLETNKTLTSSVQLATDDVEKCSQHGNEKIKFYCRTHCVVGCGTCMLMGGHKTCDHEFINDLGKDYQNSKDFRSLMTRIVSLESKTSENAALIPGIMESNNELKEKAVSDIKTFTANLRDLLNTAEETLLSDVDKLHAQNEAQMKELKLKCKSVQIDTDKVKQNLDTDRYQGNALFINAINSSEALVTLGQTLDDISSKNSLKDFNFQQNKDLLERMKFKDSYGALMISSNDEKRSGRKESVDGNPAVCENRGFQTLEDMSSKYSLQDLLKRMKFKDSYGALMMSSNDEKRSGRKESVDGNPAVCENRGFQTLEPISLKNSLQYFDFRQFKDLLERTECKNSYRALISSSNDEKRSGRKESVDGYPAVCEDRGFQIFISHVRGKTITLDVNPTDLIQDIKKMIQEKENIPSEAQKLIYQGRHLNDDHKVCDYRITKESTLFFNG